MGLINKDVLLTALACLCAGNALANSVNLTTVSEQQHNQSDFYQIQAHYPQISASDLTPQGQVFNNHIKNLITKKLQSFRFMLNQTNVPVHAQFNLTNTALSSEKISWKILFNQNDMLSLQLHEKSYVSASHIDSDFQPINFDLAKGRLLVLDDIFKPNSHYLQTIALYTRRSLASTMHKSLDDKNLIAGTEPIEKNYQRWNLTHEGILISFDAFQVGRDAITRQQVLVPFAILKSSLKQEFKL